MADTFGFRFNGGFQHIRVNAFGKHYTLRVAAGGVIQLAGQFGFISHKFAQVYAISVPILDIGTCHSAFHSSSCHGTGNFGDEAWVYRFRDEIFRPERKIVHVVCCIHDVGYRLFCQIGNSVYGGDFHFFVDRLGMRIQSTAEDVRETDNIVNLVRIVGTSGCH